jgi:hypothetical protein
MASNDGSRLAVFGLGFREHHGLRMQQLLREFQRPPANPSDRALVFTGVWALVKELTEEQIQAIQPWLQNGGAFPKHVLPPAPIVQQSTSAQSLDQHEDEGDDGEDWPDYNPEDFVDGEEEQTDEDEDGEVEDRDDEEDEDMDDGGEEDVANNKGARHVTGKRLRRHSTGNHGEADGFVGDNWAGPHPLTFQAPVRRAPAPNNWATPPGPPIPPDSPVDLDQQASGSSPQPRDPNSTDIECGICAEFYPPSSFPASSKITEKCNHDQEMMACLGCIRQDIQTTLDEGLLHRLNCPYCHEILSYEDMKKYATQETFAR